VQLRTDPMSAKKTVPGAAAEVPVTHPRHVSLMTRELIVAGVKAGVT
jgi:hypothetical protein